jgi:hypothetical protein
MGCKMRSKNCEKYKREFNVLMSSRDLWVYREPEQKFDVNNEGDLEAVEHYIQGVKDLIPVNDPRSSYDIPNGIYVDPEMINNLKVSPAREDTPRRYRVYYDTPNLEAYHGGIEIRIEFPKPTEHGHAKPYKQIVKLGGSASLDDPTFHRLEISGRLQRPIPSFEASALDGNKKLSEFLKKYIDTDDLRPLQLLTTARTRLFFHVAGNDSTTVEIATDRGHGLTLTGSKYPILQIEPEIIKGDEATLDIIGARLRDRFNGTLVPNFTSKPTPGYEHLAPLLAASKNARSFVKGLPQDEFRLINRKDCPDLFPR